MICFLIKNWMQGENIIILGLTFSHAIKLGHVISRHTQSKTIYGQLF
jgi:hypothetical protein